MARQAEIIATAVAAHVACGRWSRGGRLGGGRLRAGRRRAGRRERCAARAGRRGVVGAGGGRSGWPSTPATPRCATSTVTAGPRSSGAPGCATMPRVARCSSRAAAAEFGRRTAPCGHGPGVRGRGGASRPAETGTGAPLVHEALSAPVADLGRRADRLGTWPTEIIGASASVPRWPRCSSVRGWSPLPVPVVPVDLPCPAVASDLTGPTTTWCGSIGPGHRRR